MISFCQTSILLVVSVALVTQATIGDDQSNLLQSDEDYRKYLLGELYDEMAYELAAGSSGKSSVAIDSLPTLPSTNDVVAPSVNAHKWVKPRQPEQENKIVPTGYQFMSGGAGELGQHLKPEGSVTSKQEVKSDQGLPAYCNPPNPCPKGKTAADGCQENIPDTAAFNRNYIRRQMQSNLCGCDYEHMDPASCPENTNDDGSSDVDKLIDSILESESGSQKNPFTGVGEKRMSLTAKKGGHQMRGKRSYESPEMLHQNPYLQGDRLPVVAKKSPHML